MALKLQYWTLKVHRFGGDQKEQTALGRGRAAFCLGNMVLVSEAKATVRDQQCWVGGHHEEN